MYPPARLRGVRTQKTMMRGVRAMPYFRWIVAGLPPQRPRFKVDKVAWGQVFFMFCGSTLSVLFLQYSILIHASTRKNV